MSVPTYADLVRALGEFHRAYNADGNPVETIRDLEAASDHAADLVSRAPLHLTPEDVMRSALDDMERGNLNRAMQRLHGYIGDGDAEQA